MAKKVLTDCYISVTGPGDISSVVSKVEITADVEEKDTTTFGSGGWKESLGGLKSGTLSLTLKNDYADSGLDDDFWAILGTVVTFEVRPDADAVGAANPKYTGSILVNKWAPVSGSVGDVGEVEVSFPLSGAVTRAEA